MKPYREYRDFLSEHFETKVQKIAVDAGFSCPNRDGSKGRGGCIYCTNKAFNPRYCDATMSVAEQIEAGKRFFGSKYHDMRYIAFFQAHTGTYAPLPVLQSLCEQALAVEGIVGLVIATRPDCVGNELLGYLAKLSHSAFVMIELGVESLHDATLRRINRCHDAACAVDAIHRIAAHGIPVGAHLIMGLPGETREQMLATVDSLVALPVSTIKFHQLQVLRDTRLAQMIEKGECGAMQWSAREYARFCADLVAHVPKRIAIERFVSESPGSMLISPRWGLKPQQFNAMLRQYL